MIFAKRRELRAFSKPTQRELVGIEHPPASFKTTEIHVTSEFATLQSPNVSKDLFMQGRQYPEPNNQGHDQYSVTIGPASRRPSSEVPPPNKIAAAHPTIALRNNGAAMEANKAAFGYTKVALLFFVSLLVTWVSSFSVPALL